MDENFVKSSVVGAKFDPTLVMDVIRVRRRNSRSTDQHMVKLMSLLEVLHEMTQCHMRQHFADRDKAHRGENLRTYRRCNVNPMTMCAERWVSSRKVGESK